MVPRKRSQGGPYLVYACPTCRRTNRIEKNRAGAFLAGPPPIVPVVDALFATFDSDLKADLERKRAHARRRRGRREWFFGQHERELLAAGVRPNNVAARTGAKPPPEPERRRRRETRKQKQERRRAEPPPPPPEPEPAPPPPPPPPEPETPPTPHELLGVEPGADAETITKAFRELAKRYHPDRFEALDADFQALAHAKFIALKQAYDTLSGNG